MFGYESLPSCIFAYDVLFKNKLNISLKNLKFCQDRVFLCNVFRNKLIEVRRRELDYIANERIKLFPKYEQMLKQKDELNQEINLIHENIKANNIKNKLRETGTNEQKSKIDILKKKRTTLNKTIKIEKAKISKNIKYKKVLEYCNQFYKKEKQLVELSFKDQLFWSFRNAVKSSIPNNKYPKFKSYDHNGTLVFQFQKQNEKKNKETGKIERKASHKLTWKRVLSGEDTRISAKELICQVPLYDKNKKLIGNKDIKYVLLTLNASGIKIEAPFVMHRPLPDNCEIKLCYLTKNKIGTSEEWKIEFVISKAEGFKKPMTGTGFFAIDTNWTQQKDDTGNVTGYLIGSLYSKKDGKEIYKEYVISNKSETGRACVEYIKKVKDLQGICDDKFNKVKDDLNAWIAEAEFLQIKLPDWVKEKIKFIDKWKSPKHIYKLTKHWLNNRFPDDEKIVDILRVWIERYSHLYNWYVSQTKKYIKFRDNLYKNIRADLRKEFEGGYIEKLDINKFKKIPDPIEELKKGARIYRDIIAPGRFLEILKEGLEIEELDPYNTSKRCNNCKKVTNLNAEQNYICEFCGAKWNRQYNAAKNIWEAGEQERLKKKDS